MICSRKIELLIAIILLACAHMACIEGGYTPYVRPDPQTLPSAFLLDDPTCLVGCWRNLRPGQTNMSQLEAILKTLNLPLSWSGTDDNYAWFERSDNMVNHYTITAYTKNDLLVLIHLEGFWE